MTNAIPDNLPDLDEAISDAESAVQTLSGDLEIMHQCFSKGAKMEMDTAQALYEAEWRLSDLKGARNSYLLNGQV